MAAPHTTEESLQRARDALARRAWREAFDLLVAADEVQALEPADLESLAEAADALCDIEVVIDAYERAHAGYVQQGNHESAALTALNLVNWYASTGESAVARGWFGTAERLLEGEPEGAGHARLALVLASAADDPETAMEQAQRAIEIARRAGDRDVEMRGLHRQGRVMMKRGEIEEGTSLLDEAMTAAVAGQLGNFGAASILCNTIVACQEVADYQRAAEWIEVADRAAVRQGLVVVQRHCRIDRAGILRLRGEWAEAEGEARQACEELDSLEPGEIGRAWREIGDIRLCLGDLRGAEAALERADEIGTSPQPGMALVRLAEGNADAAASMIAHALDEAAAAPLMRARLLPAQLEIAIAVGDLDAARSAAEEQDTIARTYRTPALDATAAYGRGALQLAEGDSTAACDSLRRGWRLWQEVGAPYEAARARLLLARAYRSEGDEEAAALELRAAKSTFDRLGAAAAAEEASALLGAKAATAALRAVKTFMFTDIVQSTALVEAMGDEAWGDLLSWHDQTLRSVFVAHAGDEVNVTGDGFFVAFDDPVTAVTCAVDVQRTLAEHRRMHGFAPQVRIGVHTTEATRRGRDFGGKGVHEAARIAGLAGGGEIVVSEATLVAEPVPFATSELRFVDLKGISEPVGVAAIEWR